MSKRVIGGLGLLVVIIGMLSAYCLYLNSEIVALTELQQEAKHQIMSMQGSIDVLDVGMASLKLARGGLHHTILDILRKAPYTQSQAFMVLFHSIARTTVRVAAHQCQRDDAGKSGQENR